MATQMASVELKRVGVDISAAAYTFRATGQTILFDGYYRVYSEGRDESDDPSRDDKDTESAQENGEKILPPLSEGDQVKCDELIPEQHFTKPPPRYTEASLVKKLEEEGIGRPSTYAPTISTVQQRGYIAKEGKQLVPQDVAFTVTDLLTDHFSNIVDLKFTAGMEQSLDDIAEGKKERTGFLQDFYGPFKKLVDDKGEEVKKEDILKERVLGPDPKTGLDIVVRTGRFGPYVQVGRLEDIPEPKGKKKKEKPKSASIPGTISKDEITLEQALKLLSFPLEIGEKDGELVTVNKGRYGPYIKWGKITVTVPKDVDPSSIEFDQAMKMIEEAKDKKKKEAEPLKSLGKDPNTDGDVVVKDGRYGPYVTDGKTNASIPQRIDPQTIDLITACELLEKKRNSPKRKFKKKS